MKIKKIIFVILLIACVFTIPSPNDLHQLATALKPSFVMVIDAGHGGPDGGAEAADGTNESEINLSIAHALREVAESKGVTVVMTRETDEGLYDQQNTEKKWKKIDDLKERKRIIDEADADVVVSIHLNSFWSDTSVHGAQVFYPASKDAASEKDEHHPLKISKNLADTIQQSLIKGLADGSNRIEMEKNDIYIFKDVTAPTVLVECGFLSHQADAENLQKKQYQKKIAECIMEGIMQQFTAII